jgi:hypothetical protein
MLDRVMIRAGRLSTPPSRTIDPGRRRANRPGR